MKIRNQKLLLYWQVWHLIFFRVCEVEEDSQTLHIRSLFSFTDVFLWGLAYFSLFSPLQIHLNFSHCNSIFPNIFFILFFFIFSIFVYMSSYSIQLYLRHCIMTLNVESSLPLDSTIAGTLTK